jgi:DnaJ-class molecular chaperone
MSNGERAKEVCGNCQGCGDELATGEFHPCGWCKGTGFGRAWNDVFLRNIPVRQKPVGRVVLGRKVFAQG